MRETIAVTRFNKTTWNENCRWREQNNYTGCIYGTLQPICEKIHDNYKIYVLEMNNDTNTIEGIGIIYNKRYPREKIYSINSYNRMIYKGKVRVDKSEFSKQDSIFISYLEKLVFKGSAHVKRGSGITIIPVQIKLPSLEKILEVYTTFILQFIAKEYHLDVDIKKYIYPLEVKTQHLIIARNQEPDCRILDYLRTIFIGQKRLDH